MTGKHGVEGLEQDPEQGLGAVVLYCMSVH